MATLKEAAENYQPKIIKCISELKEVSTNIEIKEETFTKDDGTEFKLNCVEIDGEKYRVPAMVLRDLKAILEKKPDLKKFSVAKSGEGLATRYTVINL